MLELLRKMFERKPPKKAEGESKVEEIAKLQVHSDATLRRVEDVLSPEDERVRAAVRGTARGIRSVRRTGG